MYELSTPALASAVHLCGQAPSMETILGGHSLGASDVLKLIAPSLEHTYSF